MAHEVIMPKAGMSMETGTIVRWLRSPGEAVRRGEPLLVIETDKVTMEVESEADGVLLSVTRDAGEVVPVTEVIGYVGAPGESISEPGSRPAAAPPVARANAGAPVGVRSAAWVVGPGAAPPRVPHAATPLARTIARERGLDLRRIAGSGPGGAIRLRDLPAPGRLVVPTATLHMETDLTELERLRALPGPERRLPLTPFLLRAAALACRAHPLLRTSLQDGRRVTRPDVDLGAAVTREGRLALVVVRSADTMTVSQLAEPVPAQVGLPAGLAPEGAPSPVFTVINLGRYGVTTFDPILDPPQSAVLGVGALREVPAVQEDRLVTRQVLDLALGFDPAILDGLEAAAALRSIRDYLESPYTMLA